MTMDKKVQDPTPTPAETKRTEVTLKGPHTHGGKRCKEGDKIKVTDSQMERLKGLKLV